MIRTEFRCIPEPLKDLLVNLDYIAKIGVGQRLTISKKKYCDTKKFISWVARKFIDRESACDMVKFINKIVKESIEALNYYYPIDTGLFDMIMTGLIEASGGIIKLEETYKNDPETGSELRVILKEIEKQVKNARKIEEN